MVSPLEGVRVLDLSRVLSGPHCGRILSDLGADVIKLEPPEGDGTRTAQPRIAGISVYFAQQNAGKRNVSVDLQTADGARLARALAARCDVLLENFRPGVLDRLGVGYGAVRAENPGIVYCSISGYGQDGPAARRRAYAPAIHAELGILELAARRRGTDPVSEAFSHGDLYPATHAALAIVAALRHRDRTGEGQHIDISMAETLLYVNEWAGTELAGGDRGMPHVFGGAYAPVLHMADGTWICVPGNPVMMFPAWCRAMGREDLLEDQRFATPEDRQKHQPEMRALLQEWVGTFTDFDALEEALGRERLVVGAVRRVEEAARSAWALARDSVAEVDDRAGGVLELPRPPWRFSTMETAVRAGPAWRGEHNREVLRELLGMDEEEIEKLEASSVISSRVYKEET